MICVDASFIIRLLVTFNSESKYDLLWQQWQKEKRRIIAPTLLMYEVSNALFRYYRGGELTKQEVISLVDKALNLGIKLEGYNNLHQEAIKIAVSNSLPAVYDSHYLALAHQYSVKLYTCDKRLFNSVKSVFHWVIYID